MVLAIKEARVHPTVVAYMEVCFEDGFAFGRSVHFVLRNILCMNHECASKRTINM